jgi:fatty acid desaturase
MTGRDAIPWRLNLTIAAAAGSGALASLWTASHATSVWTVVAAAIAFAILNNTVFALMHEAVHGLLHPHRRANEWLGRALAAFFPTSLLFHRTCHLGHHRRNRTAVELFDYYLPEDSRALKSIQWYGILTGLYWLLPPLGCALFLVLPRRAVDRLAAPSRSARAEHVGAGAMLAGFRSVPLSRVRFEVLLTIALQLSAAWALDLTLMGWLACYSAFAVKWSALQYADHVWSPLDIRAGAWNLSVNPATRLLSLNYHHHLAHHQYPDVPWLHLGDRVDGAGPRPRFWRVYLSMWAGPRPLPPGASPARPLPSQET